MKFWTSLRALLDYALRRSRVEHEMEEELRSHLASRADDLEREGVARAKAERQARVEFGGYDRYKEECREALGSRLLGEVVADARHGLRMLARKPGFAALVILTLGLGIGANTAMFSIVDAVLLRPLPYKDPERLVVVWATEVKSVGPSVLFGSYRDFQEWQRSARSFAQLEILTWATAGATLEWHGQPRRALAIPATQGIFSLLGVKAAEGRTFQPEDVQRGCTVVLAHRFWQGQLGSAHDVVGGSLTLDGKACTVVGVMPQGFDFYPKQSDLWTLITPDSQFARQPIDSLVGVFGRLKPAVSRARAQAELTVVHQQLVGTLPKGSWLAQVAPVVYDLQSEFTWLAGRNLRAGLLILFAAVVVVLLIACLNVASLIVGRMNERAKELAVRAALGSGRGRLIRQLLTESLMLFGLGAALGTLMALAGVRCFRSPAFVELPPGNQVSINVHVLAFTALLALFTGLVFGIVPAWKATKLDDVLKESSRGLTRGVLSDRASRSLVMLEAALSMVLLVGAGLVIESIARLGSAPLGFNPDRLLTAEINLPKSGYSNEFRQAAFYDKLNSNLVELPGVQGVAFSSWLPLRGGGGGAMAIKDRPAPRTEIGDVARDTASPDFFRVMSIPVLQGRVFDARDNEKSRPVAIVNEALVREYFPHESALGKEIRFVAGQEIDQNNSWVTIVGVVGTVKRTIVYQEMGYTSPPAVYRPLDQVAGGSMGIIVHTAGSPLALRPALERAVSDLDKDVPVSSFETANEAIAESLLQPRFRAIVLGIFAALALVLAMVGLYGVLSQAVSQRTHEIGIRMALGAEKGRVLAMVARQGMVLAVGGMAIGLLAALLLTRLLTAMLYGVRPADPSALVVAALLMSLAALLAAYVPTRRATKVDPMVALRYE